MPKTPFEEAVESASMVGIAVHPNIKRRYEETRERRMADESADREVWTKGIERPDGSLLFGFDTDNPEFARGAEFGQVFMEMSVRPDTYQREVHASNLTMVKRAAKALNRQISTEEVPESMGMVYLARVGPLPERPAPMPPDVPPPTGGGGVFREQQG